MSLLDFFAILITATAVFSWANYRFLKLPATIGVMLISLVVSLGIVFAAKLGVGGMAAVERVVESIDFNTVLMDWMLGVLLFAGSLHTRLNDLAKQKFVIASMASFGVLASTFIVAGLMSLVFGLLSIEIPFIFCVLFGSLISPTDPIAVLGLLKQAGVSKSLETKVAGESLFNDGVGVVVFVVIYELATTGSSFSMGHAMKIFLIEAGGGALLGWVLGMLAYRMLKTVDQYQVEVLITLALVVGGMSVALKLHASAPIAMVVAGLFIGNHGRNFAMSEKTREHLDTFWELMDEILNAVLFVLIGMEVCVIAFETTHLVAGLLAIPVTLFARTISVSVPVQVLKHSREFSKGAVPIMIWGGLRGGISVALALALPEGEMRDLLVTVTYVVVVFSIVVQGLTVSKLAKKVC